MTLSDEILHTIKSADGMALATLGQDGPNVVPVSMVYADHDELTILDCFMSKSVTNLDYDNRVAISFWKGLAGIQLKGRVRYVQSGDRFDACVSLLRDSHPKRTLKGVLLLKPEAIHELAAKST